MRIDWLKNFINSPLGIKLVGGFAFYYLKFVGLTTRWVSVTGVKETYEMLDKYGISEVHRLSFLKKYIKENGK